MLRGVTAGRMIIAATKEDIQHDAGLPVSHCRVSDQ
jgi:hypothetical protein